MEVGSGGGAQKIGINRQVRALLVVRPAAAERQIGARRDVPGRVTERRILLIFGMQEDVGDLVDVRRDGVGAELGREIILRIDLGFFVSVEGADQPFERVVVRRRKAEFLCKLFRPRALEELDAERAEDRSIRDRRLRSRCRPPRPRQTGQRS